MNDFNDTGDQFVISHELIELMEWIVSHDQEGMKRLITKALSHGLGAELKRSKSSIPLRDAQDAQCSVLDFLELMETLLLEASSEQIVNTTVQRKVLPALDHIDTSTCDASMVQSSAAVVAAQMNKTPDENPQELLFKELLRRWNPNGQCEGAN